MQPEIITVSQFFSVINDTLGYAFPQVIIEGEVGSFKINQGKFVFFDLKDDKTTLNCFLMAFQLKLPLEDGMQIRVTGTPGVTKFSKFSLKVQSIEIAGAGELQRAMALLRQRLDAEGLFDPARKRPLPRFPRRIGLITSATSAAYADFTKILADRWGGLDIVLADVTVQGQTAPDQIVGALEAFNHLNPPVDVVVLIRGGGSLEDLSAFSTEPVTRAVAASRTPIIVGVGHEIDTSLADEAADVRAATPTDAARLIVPDRRELVAQVGHLRLQLGRNVAHHFRTDSVRLERAGERLERLLDVPKQRLSRTIWQLDHNQGALIRRVGIIRTSIQQAEGIALQLVIRPQQELTTQIQWLGRELERFLHHHLPTVKIARVTARNRLTLTTLRHITATRETLTASERLLHSLSPSAVLARGYSITRLNNSIIHTAKDVPIGASIMIELHQGKIEATRNE